MYVRSGLGIKVSPLDKIDNSISDRAQFDKFAIYFEVHISSYMHRYAVFS